MKCCCWAIPRGLARRCADTPAAGGPATEQTRYAAILPRDNLHHCAAVFIYQPITARLRNPAQRAWVAMSPAPFYTLTAGDLTRR